MLRVLNVCRKRAHVIANERRLFSEAHTTCALTQLPRRAHGFARRVHSPSPEFPARQPDGTFDGIDAGQDPRVGAPASAIRRIGAAQLMIGPRLSDKAERAQWFVEWILGGGPLRNRTDRLALWARCGVGVHIERQ